VYKRQNVSAFDTGNDFFTVKQFLPELIFEKDAPDLGYSVVSNDTLVAYTPLEPKPQPVNRLLHIDERFTVFTTDDFQRLLIKDKTGNILKEYSRLGEKGILANIKLGKFFIDKEGIWWALTNNGIIKIVQKQHPFTITQQNNSIRGTILEENKKWIGGYKGSVFPKIKKVIGNVDGTGERWDYMAKTPITQYAKDKNNHWWIGSTGAMLIEYNPAKNEQILHVFKERLHLYTPYYNHTLQQLWIGTERGLYYLADDEQTLKPVSIDIPKKNCEIRQIYENEESM